MNMNAECTIQCNFNSWTHSDNRTIGQCGIVWFNALFDTKTERLCEVVYVISRRRRQLICYCYLAWKTFAEL